MSTTSPVRLRAAALGLLLAAAFPLTASAALAPEPAGLTTLAVGPTLQTGVAAASGWTAWSDLADGRYVLRLRSPAGEITSPPAVTPSRAPFRVALGTRSSGQVVAAFDGCAGERPGRVGAVAPIGLGCRISLLDVAAGTVRRLPLAPRTRSNAVPALSGDTLAFVAVPSGKAGRTTARVMTVGLSGGAATTRWSARYGRSTGPNQLALAGRAVAAIWTQAGGDAQRLVVQTGRKAKVRRLEVASSVASCCESDALAGVAFANPSTLSVLRLHADDEGNASWSVGRLSSASGQAAGDGPHDDATGEDASALAAVALAADGARDVVLSADATHRYGVYAFTP